VLARHRRYNYRLTCGEVVAGGTELEVIHST
jgi:hypothetical protein